MTGRPTSLTLELQEQIVESILAGNYRTTAAAKVGVHRQRLAEWERWGTEGKEPYVAFADAIQKAEAAAEATLLADVKATKSGWQGKAWILERRWPHKWAARVRTVVAEEVESLEKKLRAKPELAAQVADVLAGEGTGQTSGAQH